MAAAAQYVHVPGYSALLLRASFPDLMQPDALIPRSKEWWMGFAHWNSQEKRWTFPSSATITFGYLERDDDVYQYQGAAYQFIGIDELTQHTEQRYTYLASRLRKPAAGPLGDVPLRLRGATNPGGKGHDWVRKRFVPPEYLKAQTEVQFGRPWYVEDRFFIPARLEDNPAINRVEYARSLDRLGPVTKSQLLHGDWKAQAQGQFKWEWFPRYLDFGDAYRVREGVLRHDQCWRMVVMDPAGGISSAADYTAIGVFAVTPANDLLLLHMTREHIAWEDILPRLRRVCGIWNPSFVAVETGFLQNALIRLGRKMDGMPAMREVDPGGKSKLVRALPAIIRASNGQLWLPEREEAWLEEFKTELLLFTGDDDAHDDQIDVLGYTAAEIERAVAQEGQPFTFGR